MRTEYDTIAHSPSASPVASSPTLQQSSSQQDCLTCRIVGSGAFAATGLYALHASRASAPGSIIGKRIVGGVGICFLIGGIMRWNI
ncbi:hypothetical protein SCLCIDRAFT_330811 [Scleroderma citrinum Foug A]|uniref:Distal membrane-arm assembly complex protein 1-like domain-containing protein n=1 Tax=Scleroderma citrinum Foug A TaxID=1036808 RepID=A0A0C2YZH0_9AGAM|nr:hypothetical protein SCLCIDRAFT_330811 [Scleroderma citrinum Foug A]